MTLTLLPVTAPSLRGAGRYFDWSPRNDSLLQVYWYQRTPDGRELTTAQIAERLGCNRNQVIGRARRLGLAPRPSPIQRGDRSEGRWPKEKVAAFVRLWVEKVEGRPRTFDEIAEHLNVTPLAVREAARRMGLLDKEEIAARQPARPASTLPPLGSDAMASARAEAKDRLKESSKPAEAAPAAAPPAATPATGAPAPAPAGPAPFRIGGAVQAKGEAAGTDRAWRPGRRLEPVEPTDAAPDAADPFNAPAAPVAPAPAGLPRGGRTCCWPMWGHRERPTHRYCEEPTDPTRGLTEPYCAEHRAQAWFKQTKHAARQDAAA